MLRNFICKSKSPAIAHAPGANRKVLMMAMHWSSDCKCRFAALRGICNGHYFIVTTVFTSVEKLNTVSCNSNSKDIYPYRSAAYSFLFCRRQDRNEYHPIRRSAIRRAENVFEVRKTGETSGIPYGIPLVSPARIRRNDFFLIFRSSKYTFPSNMKQRGIIMTERTENIKNNLEIQMKKLYRNCNEKSFETRARYRDATIRFC